ncbi:putative inactive leucine-rich repeat receptor-like protein kinase [Forsythia ovata]|uniref:Inactive leucine-rich repeat receptor-like protein kinase n=1 Tax=Forsythia ovata TaxID=205694 RepID=A0ABD1SKR5_9LAMI
MLGFNNPSFHICFIAAEYAYTKKATEKNDTYGFGVILLELITGWKAKQSEEESRESLDVVKCVRRKINITDGPLKVLDQKISSSSRHQMLGVLEIALRCTAVRKRMKVHIVRDFRKVGLSED